MDALPSMGLSSIANVLAAIKTAKYYDLGPDDVIVTVATDGAAMYGSERDLALAIWADLPAIATDWDRMIEEFNGRTGALEAAVSSPSHPAQHARLRGVRSVARAGRSVSLPAVLAPGPATTPITSCAGSWTCRRSSSRRPERSRATPIPTSATVACSTPTMWLAPAACEDAEYCDLVARLDEQVAEVDGHGFRSTPFGRSAVLSERLGFAENGGLWVKDETGNVSGSHKARHLFGLLVHLEVVERLGRADPDHRPHLAIASCGNAALAAAVVAAAGHRVLEVFVPVDADPVVVARLKDLDAQVTVHAPASRGLPGDPTYHRLRRALAEGALPFTCQGNENGLAIESGFSLGYEMAAGPDWAGRHSTIS
jgi:hypothetical protein